MKYIILWFRTLAAILFAVFIVFPLCLLWVAGKVVTLGLLKANFPANSDSWLFDIIEIIAGEDTWITS